MGSRSFRPILTVALFAVPVWVFANHDVSEFAIPVTNVEATMSLLYSNPPLPRSYFEVGEGAKLNGMLDIVAVDEPAQGTHRPTDISRDGTLLGWGGALLYDKPLSDRTGIFGLLIGARLNGGRFTGRATDAEKALKASGQPGALNIFQASDFKRSYSVSLAAGFNRRLVGQEDGRFSLAIFAGPSVQFSRAEGRTVFLAHQNTANSNECTDSFTDLSCVSRNYKANLLSFGVLSGLHASIRWRRVELQPFLLLMPNSAIFGDGAKVKLDGLVAQGRPGGTDFVDEIDVNRAVTPISFGVNLHYRPWGITFNLTSPWVATVLKKMMDLDRFKVFKFQITKSFGPF